VKLLSQQEEAERERCSVRTLERKRKANVGCPYVILNGRVWYRDVDSDAHIEANVHDPQKVAAEPRRRGRPPKAQTRTESTRAAP
jgi:hypothetical protein